MSRLTSPQKQRVRIRHLQEHPEPYVTVAELAAYWLVGRKQIYKQIDAGTLPAIRLGPRLMRIRTVDAIEFEGRANLSRPPERAKAAKQSVKPRAAVVGVEPATNHSHSRFSRPTQGPSRT